MKMPANLRKCHNVEVWDFAINTFIGTRQLVIKKPLPSGSGYYLRKNLDYSFGSDLPSFLPKTPR